MKSSQSTLNRAVVGAFVEGWAAVSTRCATLLSESCSCQRGGLKVCFWSRYIERQKPVRSAAYKAEVCNVFRVPSRFELPKGRTTNARPCELSQAKLTTAKGDN